jgi:hypothetical protein
LYEEIEAIDADEEDDKAMGVDIPTEKLNANEEVRKVPLMYMQVGTSWLTTSNAQV